MSWRLILFLGVLPILELILAQDEINVKLCPTLLNKVWEGYSPKGKKEAGLYHKEESIGSLEACVAACCDDSACNIVFMFDTSCYKVECESDAACEPVKRTDTKFIQNARMVLVRPLNPALQWEQVLALNNDSEDIIITTKVCLPGSQDCPPNEICLPAGVCGCDIGFKRAPDLTCQPVDNTSTAPIELKPQPPRPFKASPGLVPTYSEGGIGSDIPSQVPLKKLTVSVISKQVRLPDNEATLSAFTVPFDPSDGTKYDYKWKLLSQPDGSEGTMSETANNMIKLNHLTEGLYTFRVTVSGPGAEGEALANVTVLPEKRENEPPLAVVNPPSQTVKLPNSGAVLDASASRDDNGIVKFHWELQQGPLGYQPNLTETPTLQLRELQKPGNYTFRLTVTDAEGATNSTTADLIVLESPDYPPEANAGSSVVLYLPKNNVTLNGNMSSDDRGIVSWEWTKSPGQDKAVDMQNTHTPYLQLSHLEEGMYTFSLKVTDDSGQSSTSDVHVFVKPPTNQPPTANAGENITIALPLTWTVLNGSLSSDDISIVHWEWQQLSGPTKAVILSANESVTNVTGLTKGEYTFQLNISDGNGNAASSAVGVTVTQTKNSKPKADAGEDRTLLLPLDYVLTLNGSGSSDDLGIAKWQWTREPTSLAMGTIINQSNQSPILTITNIVPGRYEFRLRVTDDQGEFDEDTVSVIVKPDKDLLNLVEVTLNIAGNQLTEAQRDSVLSELGLVFLRDASKLFVRDLRVEDRTGRAKLLFYVEGPHGPTRGPLVVSALKDKLARDPQFLNIPLVHIRTAICQNNCSGHGHCDEETRDCICESFWMPDLFNYHFGDGESNCDWSILYVGLALVCILVLAGGAVWGLVCLCSRLFCFSPPKNNNKRYARLNSTEQIKLPISKAPCSDDSGTDSDVLFESRHGKTNGYSRKKRNGYKSQFRIST